MNGRHPAIFVDKNTVLYFNRVVLQTVSPGSIFIFRPYVPWGRWRKNNCLVTFFSPQFCNTLDLCSKNWRILENWIRALGKRHLVRLLCVCILLRLNIPAFFVLPEKNLNFSNFSENFAGLKYGAKIIFQKTAKKSDEFSQLQLVHILPLYTTILALFSFKCTKKTLLADRTRPRIFGKL